MKLPQRDKGVWVGGHEVLGAVVDAETRCAHWHGPDDVLAVLFKCCDRWFPCHACHQEASDHPSRTWTPAEDGVHAILCGRCGHTSAISTYRATGACASCGDAFNEGCRLHHHLYFE